MFHLARTFLWLPLVVYALTAAASENGSEQPPNIIIVMPDDMGYGDLGFTGNPVVRTPNLDRFASESARLTEFYVSPVCSPTRACLMTGHYNYRTRVIDTFKGRSMMDPDEVTLAERLGDAGYATGIFGKWHLGDNYPLRPMDQGFDESLIHRGGGLAQPSEPIENDRRYTNPILFHNGEQVQTEGYCTDVYFDAAMDFMKSAVQRQQPFFVYLPPNAPHGPFHDVPEDLLAYYQSVDLTPVLGKNQSKKHQDTVARVFAMVENIDQNFGRLDRFLQSNGLKENTLVLFLTDNGPNTNRYVGPFREMKSHVHEGGIRTVFFARWPASLTPGVTSDRIAAHIDIFPTVAAAAGVSTESGNKLDGKNLLPLLRGEADGWPDRALFFQSHRGNRPVEFHHFGVRTQNWKLVRSTGFGRETIVNDAPFELYRITGDPGERQDVSDQYPDKLKELKSRYQDWFHDVSQTRDDNYAPPRIVIGSDQEPTSVLSIQDWRVGESSGWGNDGRWKVRIVDAGPYRATVRWDSPIGNRNVTLSVGDQQFRASLEPGQTSVTLPSIELPLGAVDIGVEVTPAKGAERVRFVTLERHSTP
ncbi:arylsulfatase [Roseiconus nitratireducens]|uniref:Arylsulfatase n=1 Tax=Roseiconus nitratireducens TaxID=2605748 RepID=A0A5M6DEC0_9BACT|nr:arylsulfatase [Roseiconus nitratireducens]KAA5545868.1 arylsulfatase [Roseiconus nitratireducens]